MNKQEFLTELEKGLAKLSPEEIQEHLYFYSEMIDDRMEDNIPEEEAILLIGDVNDIINQILSNTHTEKTSPKPSKSKRRFRAWEITLLILGSPLWLSLLLAGFSILLAVYSVLWSVIISLWAIFISLVGVFLCGIFCTILCAFKGFGATAITMFGIGIFCLGLSIFMFYGCKYATKGFAILTKSITLKIISFFTGKEKTK